MKRIITLALASAAIMTASAAQAEVEAPLYSCALTFNVKGGGIKVFVGHFRLRGPGEINCIDLAGNVETIPVNVVMGGSPISLGVGAGYMNLAGLATGIGLSGSPQDLLGTYFAGSMRGSLLVGAGAELALHAADRALTLNASVQAVSGLGANVGFDYLNISAR